MKIVKSELFWREAGEFLLVERTRRGWNPIDVERAGGPNYATVQEHERGNIRTTDALNRHVLAFGFEFSDLLRNVLDRVEGDTPMPPEIAQIARKYQSTTVQGRQALIQIVQALPDEEVEPAPTPPLPPSPPLRTAESAQPDVVRAQKEPSKTLRRQAT